MTIPALCHAGAVKVRLLPRGGRLHQLRVLPMALLHALALTSALQPTPPKPHPVLRRSASTWTQADRSSPHASPDRVAALILHRDGALSSSDPGRHVAAADAFAAELAAMGVVLSDTHRVWNTQPPAPSGWVQSDLGDAAATGVDAAWVDGLLVRRNEALAAGDYATANALRGELRDRGVTISDRARAWRLAGSEPLAAAVTSDGHYTAHWHARAASLRLVSLEGLASRAANWADMPLLQHYREISKPDRRRVGRELGRLAGARLARAASSGGGGSGLVLAIEKPHVDGFVDGLAEVLAATEGEAAAAPALPFVLLALNGGDEPLTTAAQACPL